MHVIQRCKVEQDQVDLSSVLQYCVKRITIFLVEKFFVCVHYIIILIATDPLKSISYCYAC